MRLILLTLLFFTSLSAEIPRLIPAALQKGDLIAIVFPASYLDKVDEEAEERIQNQVQWLQSQGYQTILYPTQRQRYGYLAGTDTERAANFMNAWKNPQVKALWCFRGGFGTQRILDQLDYDIIKANPKILIGMSDITALHHAIQQRTGLVTFLAPVLNYFNATESSFNNQYALSHLKNVIENPVIGEIPLPKEIKLKVLRKGIAKGRLIGGNLTLIAGLCGTKWQLNTKGKILILEDVSEDIYRIDRMLWQLKQAHLLDNLAAVILGDWVGCKSNLNYSLTLEQVFDNYFGNAPYPVIRDYPSGHGNNQATIPLNSLVEVNTYIKKVTLLEKAVLCQ